MDLTITADDACHLFSQALRVAVELRDGSFFADLDGETAQGPAVADYDGLVRLLQGFEIEGEATIFNARELETLVREESPFVVAPWARRGEIPLRLDDPDLGLTYTLGYPTDHFTIFIVHRVLALAPDERLFWRRRFPRPRGRVHQPDLPYTNDDDAVQIPTVLKAVRDAMPRVLSLRIQSARPTGLRQLQQHADAFAFQMAYNLDTAFVSVRSLEEVIRRTRLRRIRRVRPDELDPPRRTYGADLVYHYQLAVSTESVLLEFLSYFHVAEHFFEEVFEDDLIASTKETLTDPGFSFRRKQDIRGLIKQIQNRFRFQHEDVTFSEQEALRLVLDRYVDLATLHEKLASIQASLVDYYRTTTVSFSRGDAVDLAGDDRPVVIALLAKRIYKTRNAVVHSKQGGKPRYQPFHHDRELAQELPLMRLVAEEIIVNSSTAPA